MSERARALGWGTRGGGEPGASRCGPWVGPSSASALVALMYSCPSWAGRRDGAQEAPCARGAAQVCSECAAPAPPASAWPPLLLPLGAVHGPSLVVSTRLLLFRPQCPWLTSRVSASTSPPLGTGHSSLVPRPGESGPAQVPIATCAPDESQPLADSASYPDFPSGPSDSPRKGPPDGDWCLLGFHPDRAGRLNASPRPAPCPL